MRNKAMGITLALAMIVFVLLYKTGGLERLKVELGGATLGPAELPKAATLVTPSTTAPAGGSYESMDFPRGTTYVTAGGPFRITSIRLTADASTSTVVLIGHGANHVESSTTTPAGAITVGEFTVPAAAGLVSIDTYLVIPVDRFPWVRLSGPTTWPSAVLLSGIRE